MTKRDSVEGRERLRLFCGLPLPDDAVGELVAWQARELAGARETRVVPPGNLHVTLAFLGGRPTSDVGPVLDVLRAAPARATPPGARQGESVRSRSLSFGAATERGAVRDRGIGCPRRMTT